MSLKPASKSMVRLETAQVLELANLTKDTLRHWKRVLSPIRDRDGRSARYTLHEVAALAVIARAVHDLSVPISRFTEHAEGVFAEIETLMASGEKPKVLCVTPEDVLFTLPNSLPDAETMAIVRIEPVLRKLSEQISGAPASPLHQLMLPL